MCERGSPTPRSLSSTPVYLLQPHPPRLWPPLPCDQAMRVVLEPPRCAAAQARAAMQALAHPLASYVGFYDKVSRAAHPVHTPSTPRVPPISFGGFQGAVEPFHTSFRIPTPILIIP